MIASADAVQTTALAMPWIEIATGEFPQARDQLNFVTGVDVDLRQFQFGFEMRRDGSVWR
jgi:hypothetical protein